MAGILRGLEERGGDVGVHKEMVRPHAGLPCVGKGPPGQAPRRHDNVHLRAEGERGSPRVTSPASLVAAPPPSPSRKRGGTCEAPSPPLSLSMGEGAPAKRPPPPSPSRWARAGRKGCVCVHGGGGDGRGAGGIRDRFIHNGGGLPCQHSGGEPLGGSIREEELLLWGGGGWEGPEKSPRPGGAFRETTENLLKTG
jgi:hypothetical protein